MRAISVRESVAIDKFGQNIYQANLLSEAVDMYAEYENKLKTALEDEMDETYIKSLKAESDYYEQIFRISLVLCQLTRHHD